MTRGQKFRRTALAVTLFLFALYVWSYRGTSHSTDEWLFIDEMTRALREGLHTIPLQYASFYALGIPLLLLSRLVGTFGTYQTLTLLNSATTALAGGIMVLVLGELGYGVPEAAVTALVYGAATLAWPYSGYLLREPTTAMWLMVAAWLLLRYRVKGGWWYVVGSLLAFTGAAFTKQSASFLLFLYVAYFAYSLYARKEPKLFWEWWLPLQARHKLGVGLAFAAIVGLIFWFPVRAYVPFPRHLGEAIPSFKGLMGLLFSPGWGLFLFSPVLLLTIPGIPGFFRKHFWEALLLVGAAWVYILGCTRQPLWWGTWNWGPRQVNPILPMFTLPLAETLRLYGGRRAFKIVLGILLVVSVALAGMQTLVAYPFYQVAFRSGITDVEFTWNWHTSPPLNHWRFLKITDAEVAWATSSGVRWPLLLSLSVLVGLAAWFLIRTTGGRFARWSIYVGGVALLSVFLVAATLHLSYLDEDYGGNQGFAEAAQMLREEGKPGDKLVIYMWGEPPWAYIPRVAMLNYCKGLCPPHIVVIKEQFIDGQPGWEGRLRQLVGDAKRVWVVMEGLPETSPDRPVEIALAQWLYYAGSTWTGQTVRVARFDRGGDKVLVLGEEERETPNLELLSFSIRASDLPIRPGECLDVDLKWRIKSREQGIWNVSYQLLDGGGQLAAQLDHPLTLFTKPGGWGNERLIEDKTAFCLPADISPGLYQLILVVYDSRNMARENFTDGQDYLVIGQVEIKG
ncbi:MAG: hypothetical protein DRI61_03740 [Chloroflexi bacterium]|nr:MAG: hypothetical protein DRI61_03740 [Chloroflexota bacterium]